MLSKHWYFTNTAHIGGGVRKVSELLQTKEKWCKKPQDYHYMRKEIQALSKTQIKKLAHVIYLWYPVCNPAFRIMPETTSPARGSRNLTPRIAPPKIMRETSCQQC